MEILRFIITVIIMAVAEMCCTMYIIATEKRQALAAATYCALIVSFSTLLTLNYVDDKKMIVATIVGAFLGTFITIKIKK